MARSSESQARRGANGGFCMALDCRVWCVTFSGSPQESDEVGILGGFLESEEFGLGSGQSLCLEQEIVHVTVATTSAKDRLDISVDRFHHAERNLIRTIVQDSVEVLD